MKTNTPSGLQITREVLDSVDFERPEYTAMLPIWSQIRDCLEGEAAVKSKGLEYLPMPNAQDQSVENQERYVSYKQRASFFGATERTIQGLVGQAFGLPPDVLIHESLDTLKENADGDGVSLEAQAQQALQYTLAFGRGGLMVDYPQTDGGVVTAKDKNSGEVLPNIILYSGFNIINWRTRSSGKRKVQLSLVVLREDMPVDGSGYEISYLKRWRVLYLNEAGEYVIDVFEEKHIDGVPQRFGGDNEKNEVIHVSRAEPRDNDGNRLKFIPFTFLGAVNNSPSPDKPPMEAISNLNIAHYRNSAEYEETVYMVGQPTYWMSGLTQAWVKEVFKDSPVQVGSRAMIPLPENAQAGILQPSPNTLARDAMTQKESQMAALGAKLIEPASVQRTLGEARISEATGASILVTCVKNVNIGYTQALKWAEAFHGSKTDGLRFAITTDFAISRLEPNERVALLSEWQAGGITMAEYRNQLRKAGIASETNDGIPAEPKTAGDTRTQSPTNRPKTETETKPEQT